MRAERYVKTGRAGTFEFVGAGVKDELYSHQDLGLINVTHAWTLVPEDTTPYRVPLTEGLVQHLRFRDLDPQALAKMTSSRMREPVLCVWLPTGMELIDGAHRIERRRQKGRDWYETFVLIPEAVGECRVRIFKLGPDGARTEVDTRYGSLGFKPTKGLAPK